MGATKTYAIVAACLFWLASLFQALISFGLVGGQRPAGDMKKYTSFDYDYLKAAWAHRREVFPYEIGVSFIACLAYVFLLAVGMEVKRIFDQYNSKGNGHEFAAMCIALAAALPFLEFLQEAGAYQTADAISQWSGINAQTMPALEISFLLVGSQAIWVYSMDWILLSTAMFIIANLTLDDGNTFTKGHAYLGITTGVIGVIAFILELSVFAGYTPVAIEFGVMVLLFGVIFFPIWLIVLGVQADKIMVHTQLDESHELQETNA